MTQKKSIDSEAMSHESRLFALDQTIMRLLESSEDVLEKEGFPGFARLALDRFRILPVFENGSDIDFDSSREHLDNDPGLLVSNHPGHLVDTLIIASQLSRRDIRILSRSRGDSIYQKYFGNDIVWSLDQGVSNIREGVERSVDHISEGGVVLIYPSGVNERGEKEIDFKPGVKWILDRMNPSDMVYSFYFDYLSSEKAKMNIEQFIGGQDDIEEVEVVVSQHYSPAEDWQKTVKDYGADRSESAKRLTLKYRNIFGLD